MSTSAGACASQGRYAWVRDAPASTEKQHLLRRNAGRLHDLGPASKLVADQPGKFLGTAADQLRALCEIALLHGRDGKRLDDFGVHLVHDVPRNSRRPDEAVP